METVNTSHRVHHMWYVPVPQLLYGGGVLTQIELRANQDYGR